MQLTPSACAQCVSATADVSLARGLVSVDNNKNVWLLPTMQAGKMVLAATAAGAIRVYKYPLTGEFTEVRYHSSPITCLRAFYDESVVFSCAEDGSVFVFDVKMEQDAAALKRDVDRLPFADEVVVTKSDLEERKARCARHRACEDRHAGSAACVLLHHMSEVTACCL